jgi:hypothetical protein
MNDTKQKGKTPTSIQNTNTTIVIISKVGSLSECVVEPASETTLEELTILLSKKCGYRNHNGFSCYHTYRYKNKRNLAFQVSEEDVIPKYIYVDVWAKTEGRAGYENKYEMPPPIDELIFYGNIALVARMDNETAIHLNYLEGLRILRRRLLRMKTKAMSWTRFLLIKKQAAGI